MLRSGFVLMLWLELGFRFNVILSVGGRVIFRVRVWLWLGV